MYQDGAGLLALEEEEGQEARFKESEGKERKGKMIYLVYDCN